MNVGGEVPTEEIMKRSLKQKKIIAMPSFTEEKGVEEVYRVENPEKDLIRNENGRLEPDRTRCKPIPMEQVDIAIIPGLAFDEKGDESARTADSTAGSWASYPSPPAKSPLHTKNRWCRKSPWTRKANTSTSS